MEESERETSIKTLTGESSTVSVSGGRTIEDFSFLLRGNFPFSTISPNFYLFFKGTKLNPQSQTNARRIDHGEYLVLISFIKKDSSKSEQRDQYEQGSSVSSGISISQIAGSVWSDMVQDLSYLHDCSVEGREENEAYRERGGLEVGGVDAELVATWEFQYLNSNAKGEKGFVYSDLKGNLIVSNWDEHTCESHGIQVFGFIG